MAEKKVPSQVEYSNSNNTNYFHSGDSVAVFALFGDVWSISFLGLPLLGICPDPHHSAGGVSVWL